MKKYVKLSTLCNMYEVHKDFFTKRMDKEFFKDIHYIKQSNTIRWDIEEVEKWWRDETISKELKEEIFNKILP